MAYRFHFDFHFLERCFAMNLRRLLHNFVFIGGFTFLLLLPLFAVGNPSTFFPLDEIYDYELTVLDETGLPLPGVNIFSDDYTVAASTDMDGIAYVKDVKYNQELNFTFIGYQAKKLPFHEIRKKNGKVKMLPEVLEFEEIIVIGRRDDRPEDVPYTTDQVTQEDLALTESQTSVDALQQHAGVFIQKSQMGGGSPIMRGFEANRVLLVVDGVRMNNAIYRGGHLQNAITIDNGMLERMEVTFGPGALLYGSDALGGVVHFRSKEPKLDFNKTSGSSRSQSNFYSRFASANEEKSFHADVNFGKKNWASLTSFTFTDYGALRAGNNRPEGYEHLGRRVFLARRVDGGDQVIQNVNINKRDSSFTDISNIQFGTAYSQMDFAQKIKFQPDEQKYHLFNFQFSTTSDVPRYDALIEKKSNDPKDLKWAEWFYGPQKRLLTSWKTRLSNPTSWYDRATFIGSFQFLEEDRIRRKLNDALRQFNLEEVQVYALTADFDKQLDSLGNQQLIYGAELNYNDVNSSSGSLSISDERIYLNQLTRYPGEGNRVMTGAVYGNYKWASKDTSLVANAGLRYTVTNLYSKFGMDSIIIWPTTFTDGLSSTNSDLTWAGGLTYTTNDNLQIKALVSKAFRSPNLDDFSKIREKNNIVTIPNQNLVPETSINYELSIGKQFGGIDNKGQGTAAQISATGYYTSIKNFIVRRDASLPGGSRQLIMGNDTLETVANFNAATGRIYGGTFAAQIDFGSRLKFKSSINFIKGQEAFFNDEDPLNVIDTLVPASHIPPTHGNASLTYKGKKLTVGLAAHYFGKKPVYDYGIVNIYTNDIGETVIDRDGGSDNLDLSYTTSGYYFEEIIENGETNIKPACNNPGPEGECEPEYLGTLSYTLFNLYTSLKLTDELTLGLAIENIADLHYRPFSSGVSGAGRNFIVSLRANFGE